MSGSVYGIRTRVTAVRGRPGGLSKRDQRRSCGHRRPQQLLPFAAKIRAPFPNSSQRSQSRTGDLGCRMIADPPRPRLRPGRDPRKPTRDTGGLPRHFVVRAASLHERRGLKDRSPSPLRSNRAGNARRSRGDDDSLSSVSLSGPADGRRSLSQRVRPIDDQCWPSPMASPEVTGS